MRNFRLAVLQFAPVLRDVAGNAARIARASAEAGADLLLTPELSLTGYDLRDDAALMGRPIETGESFSGVFGCDVGPGNILVGAVQQSASAIPYNSALLVSDGTIRFVHRKIYLPTYGMFDEGRYFGRGQHVDTFELNGWRIGVLICEDFWHPMLPYLQSLQGVHALLVMAAAPGRGVRQGGEGGGFFASSDAWERIARAYAQLYGIYVVVCNRCGVEGAVTFGGESFVVAPDTTVAARAGIDEEILNIELSADAISSARTPYVHARDEDIGLALRELQRIAAS